MIKSKNKIVETIKSCTVIFLYVVLIPIFILNLIFITNAIVNKDEVPSVFGVKMFVVTTGSMEPTIKPGDLIFSKQIAPENLKEQDIISFSEGKTVVTHRIEKIESEGDKLYFLTKGDNNNEYDKGRVEDSNVEGIYVKNIPNLGNVILFMQSKFGIILIVVVPLCLISAYYIVASKISNNKKNKEILELQKKMQEETKNK